MKLLRNKRGGVSVAIAIVMSMALVFSVVTNVFLWEMALREEALKRSNEKLDIQDIYINDGIIFVEVENLGSVTIHLVGLWINETRYSIDTYLNIGEIETLDETSTTYDSEFTYEIMVVTERGNSVSNIFLGLAYRRSHAYYYYTEVSEGGVFRIDWFFCNYTSKENPVSQTAVSISRHEEYVAFYLRIINNWVYPCKILKPSFLTLLLWGGEPVFYVVENVTYETSPHPTIISYTQELVIEPQEQHILIFASDSMSGSSWQWKTSFPSSSNAEGCSIQISLFFEVNDEIYGQTISTQATIIED